MRTLLVVSSPASHRSDTHVAGMASFLGASVRLIDVFGGSAFDADGSSLCEEITRSVSLVVHAETLAILAQHAPSRAVLREKLLSADSVLLHGVTPGAHDELVRWITGGAVTGSEGVVGADTCELPVVGKNWTRQMAGLRFARADAGAPTSVFVSSMPAQGLIPLVTADGRPTFGCLQHAGCSLFLSVVPEFPAPSSPVATEEEFEEFYEVLLPLLVFVRAACADFCWRGGWSGARLIIDDPVLRHVYGHLNFHTLFASLRRHRYAATIAYIPWNQSRTSKKMAAFFRTPASQFSLCVHGCDHTNDEYGATDGAYLERKSRLALERMQRHQARTGIGFEPVMVFPQGRFSRGALRGLRASGYLGAINSTRFPVDNDAPFRLCDLLLPAVAGPQGFPVFGRHYVDERFATALDLFLGRPAFLVEHHEFFKAGFPVIEDVVDWLNASEPGLSWASLSQTVERTCWKRAVSESQWEVRFFADRFVLTNSSERQLSYRLLRDEPDPGAVAAVSLNGRPSPLTYAGGHLLVDVTLNPGETIRVDVRHGLEPSEPSVRDGRLYAGKVFLRRALSELRDEVLVKHPTVLCSAKRMVRALKVSSDSLPDEAMNHDS